MIEFASIDGNEAVGHAAHLFLLELDQHLGANCEFRSFVAKYAPTKKWMLLSDYCLGDKNKPNDSVCFTLLPHVSELDTLIDALKQVAPKDIKSVRMLNPKFIQLLSRYPSFHVGIVLNKDRKLAPNEWEFFRIKVQCLQRQLAIWQETTPEGAASNASYRKKLARLERAVLYKNTNLKLLRDTEITSTIAGYLAAVVSVPETELVTWLSDRDSILSHLTEEKEYPLAFDLAYSLHHVLCAGRQKNPKTMLAFGVPEATGSMWYDPLNRIPDVVCGTLADYDLQAQTITHAKFIPVLREIFCNPEKSLFYRLSIHPDRVVLSELGFQLSAPAPDEAPVAED